MKYLLGWIYYLLLRLRCLVTDHCYYDVSQKVQTCIKCGKSRKIRGRETIKIRRIYG
jgi:hypothetical protein